MKLIRLLLLILAVGTGCQKAPPAINPNPSADDTPREAQPRLPTVKLWLGTKELTSEVARAPRELQTGMMFRKSMEENEAMLFVLPQPQQASFYMRNTYVPLSCAYLDDEGAILEIHDLKPLNETSVVSSSENVRFVLETRQGWFERHNIPVGTVVSTSQGSLPRRFLGQP
jgi:uncharacterized membrane protein (UPF0127 family)